MGNRKGESTKTYFRAAGRSLLVEGQWYFATREGVDVGPYPSKKDAEAGAARLAKMLRGVEDPIAIQKIMNEFMALMGNSKIKML